MIAIVLLMVTLSTFFKRTAGVDIPKNLDFGYGE